jgi:hypothetical protein
MHELMSTFNTQQRAAEGGADDVDAHSDDDGAADPAHEAMLETLLSRKSKAPQKSTFLNEAVEEGEFNVGAAGADEGGPMRMDELMQVTDLSKVDRKLLAKVVKGSAV